MESSAKYALVGVGILVLTSMLIFSLLWLLGKTETVDERLYTIYFREQSLDGLQVDSQVNMKGIKVGSVATFSIAQRDIERVKVTIRVHDKTPIKTDTKAIIKRNLLTGLAMIELAESSQQAQSLSRIPAGEDYPVIPEGKSQFENIAGSLPGVIDNLAELTERANTLLSDENQAAVTKIVANLESVTSALAGQKNKIEKIVDNANAISTEMRKILEGLNGDQPGMFGEELAAAAKAGREAIESINAESKNFTIALQTLAQALRLQLFEISKNIDKTSTALTSTLEKFENPSRVLAGPPGEALGPGEATSR